MITALVTDRWKRFRPVESTRGTEGVSGPPPAFEDSALVERIRRSYRVAEGRASQEEKASWLGWLKVPYHASLLSDDPDDARRMFADPASNVFHYGFEETCLYTDELRHGCADVIRRADWIYDLLRRLGEAVGTERMQYPEVLPSVIDDPPEVEDMLLRLDEAFGFKVDFPNPFPGEAGMVTSRGIAAFRSVQSLYQAYRIRSLLADPAAARVIEIGGGIGKTAYYACKFGIGRYAIVDIPLTGAAQANYLGRVEERAMHLEGEAPDDASLRLMAPGSFFEEAPAADLIVSIDGLTEMPRANAEGYWAEVRRRRTPFMSINHEANPFTFRELYQASPGCLVDRRPYWLRHGYLEEIATFYSPSDALEKKRHHV